MISYSKNNLINNCKIMTETDIFIITVCSVISSVIFCLCFRYYKDRNTQINERIRLNNSRKKIMLKFRIKPIIEITDDQNINELKDEFEQYEVRQPQITGEQNV
jgi:hypothetical protein